jgi:hypothetical protein
VYKQKQKELKRQKQRKEECFAKSKRMRRLTVVQPPQA